jgi:hypothetical protein
MQSTAAASPLIHLSFHDRREKLPRRRTTLAKSIAHKFSSRPKVTPALAFDPRRQSGAKQAAGRSQGSIDKFIPTLSPPRIASLLCLPPPPNRIGIEWRCHLFAAPARRDPSSFFPGEPPINFDGTSTSTYVHSGKEEARRGRGEAPRRGPRATATNLRGGFSAAT